MTTKEIMPLGVFTSIGAGLGAGLDAVQKMGVPTVQVHAPPPDLRTPQHAEEVCKQFNEADIDITLVFCGYPGESYATIEAVRETVGLVPPETREKRVRQTRDIADFASAVDAPGIGIHVGFVPEDTDSDEFAEIVGILKGLCEYCKAMDLTVNLETGQETASTLLTLIEEVGRDNLCVNFDPANMILYGSGEPLEALRKVGQYVRSCHCKDAVGSDNPGVEWGEEVPLGEGDVNIEEYMRTLVDLGYEGPLTIEREISGEQQVKDIEKAIELLRSLKEKLL